MEGRNQADECIASVHPGIRVHVDTMTTRTLLSGFSPVTAIADLTLTQ